MSKNDKMDKLKARITIVNTTDKELAVEGHIETEVPKLVKGRNGKNKATISRKQNKGKDEK